MNKENTTLILAFSGALLAVFLCSRGCIKPTTPPTNQNRDSIIVKIDTLKVHDKVLVERWRKAIHTTDSVVSIIEITAPDTCDTYITQVVTAYQNERDSVSDVVNSKDSIITQYATLKAVDDTIIATLQNDTTTLRKQLKRRGKVAFVAGYVSGILTGVIINNFR
jgi:tetrahydromethanopterin S-methyltransferase subunit B